jgi:predicted nucleotidyltransferase
MSSYGHQGFGDVADLVAYNVAMGSVVTSRREISDRVQRLLPQLRRHGVKRLALFGSFTRDVQQADSDVDFLVEFLPEKKTFDNFFAVSELLEESLGRRVELLTPESLSPYIGPHILQEAEDVFTAH